MRNRYKILKQGSFRYAIWDKQEGALVPSNTRSSYSGALLLSTRKEAMLTVKHLNRTNRKVVDQ